MEWACRSHIFTRSQIMLDFGELPFDREIYKIKLQRLRESPHMTMTSIPITTTVDRQYILTNARSTIMSMDPATTKSKLWRVQFRGEPGIDIGGPKREFFTLVAQRLFSPEMALFDSSASSNYAVHIHPLSSYKKEEWFMYEFAGRFLAMAIIQEQIIGTKFSLAFFKLLLGQPCVLDDLKEVEMDVHRSIKYVVDNDPEDLCLTFTYSYEEFGVQKEIDLKPKCGDINVTEANKAEYIQLLIDFHTTHLNLEQIGLVRKGFFQLIPKHVITTLECSELQFLLSGTSEINVADWKANTVYENCDDTHEVVIMFWEVVESKLSNMQRTDLLQFVTGSPFVPITGFKDLQGANGKAQKFTITFRPSTASPAIVSHSCFNQICIPRHHSRSQFEEYLQQAILQKEGFDKV